MSTQSTLQFCDSCQHYDGSQIMRKWILASGTAVWLATGGRRGGGALSILVGTKLGWTFPAASFGMASASVGGAFTTNHFPLNVISFSSAPLSIYAAPEIMLQLDSSGIPFVTINGTTVASGSFVIASGVFYYYEFAFWLTQTLSSGVLAYVWNLEAWITSGGDPATRTLLLSAANLTNSAPASIGHTTPNEGLIPSGVPNMFYLHGPGGGGTLGSWCDIWACGSSASPMTDQGGGTWYDIPQTFGDQRVDAVRRVTDASAHATPSTAGAHYPMVTDVSPDDLTTTLAYPTAGVQDLGLFGTFPQGTIAGAQFISAVAKDTAGPAAFKQVWNVGGVDYTDGVIYAPSAQAWPFVCRARMADIASSNPYTTAILGATAFGIERTS